MCATSLGDTHMSGTYECATHMWCVTYECATHMWCVTYECATHMWCGTHLTALSNPHCIDHLIACLALSYGYLFVRHPLWCGTHFKALRGPSTSHGSIICVPPIGMWLLSCGPPIVMWHTCHATRRTTLNLNVIYGVVIDLTFEHYLMLYVYPHCNAEEQTLQRTLQQTLQQTLQHSPRFCVVCWASY